MLDPHRRRTATTPAPGFERLEPRQLFAAGGFGPVAPTAAATDLSLPAVADAYVKDGTPDTNYGVATELQVGRSVTPGLQRISYLRFDVADLAAPGALGAATLRLYGAASSSALPVTVDVFPSGNVTWSENTVTWNNNPGTGYFDWLPPATVTGTTPRRYDWDVTEYVRQQVAAGADAVTFALVGRSNIDPYARFNSREAADPATRPQLFVEPEPTDRTAPTRKAVTVGSTQWTPQYLASLAARGLGDGGVSLPQYFGEDGLRRRLPWVNADTINVRFSEDVRVRQDHLRILKWDEQRSAFVDAGYAYRAFRYDAATHVATWVLERPLGRDTSLRLELEGDAPDAIADPAGNRLYAGADSIQDFSTLPGDATGEGRVDAEDLAFVRQRFNSTPADEAFNPFDDVNGDGRINALDLAAIRRHLNQTGG